MGASRSGRPSSQSREPPADSDHRSLVSLSCERARTVLGSFLPLLLIEPYGFRQDSADRCRVESGRPPSRPFRSHSHLLRFTTHRKRFRGQPLPRSSSGPTDSRRACSVLLSATGLATMGIEFIRIGLHALCGPVGLFLRHDPGRLPVSHVCGLTVYRDSSRAANTEPAHLDIARPARMLPLLTTDVASLCHLVARVFLGVIPSPGWIGFLTPMLVDHWSGGDPDRAGRAYAVNVVGCIIGPLVCGFLLLPLVGEHSVRASACLAVVRHGVSPAGAPAFNLVSRAAAYRDSGAGPMRLAGDQGFRNPVSCPKSVARLHRNRNCSWRRHEAAALGEWDGNDQADSHHQNDGAHDAGLARPGTPHSALIICFGMGTTFRSVVAWNISSTAVELVPSVPKLFSFYHADAAEVMASPLAHVVIDDGRRFLERSPAKYRRHHRGPSTAGSDSRFEPALFARLLRPGQAAAAAGGNPAAMAARGRRSHPSRGGSRHQDFLSLRPRVSRDREGWGWHFLASERPIPIRTAAELVARIPAGAVTDMMEWGPASSPEEQMNLLLDHQSSTDAIIALSPATATLTDDRPINEYFLLRTPFDQLMAME